MIKIRNLILGFGIALFIAFVQGSLQIIAQATTPDPALQQQAETLTEEGHKQLSIGQTNQALDSWKEAGKIYQKLHNQEGITGSLINQSLALEELGLNFTACNTLLKALKLEENGWLCNSSLFQQPVNSLPALKLAIKPKLQTEIDLLGLQNLGDVLRLMGRTDESELILETALAQHPKALFDNLLLSLGNTEQAIFNQLQDKYADVGNLGQKKDPIQLLQKKIALSSQLYQQLNQTSHSSQSRA